MRNYKYFAFISYRHTDIAKAKQLQKMLERYNLPSSIKKQLPDVPKHFKIFRDADELTSCILSEGLQKNLRESKFLIVICSVESAKSQYVGEEIAFFRSLGKEKNIIPFIIDGIPHSKDSECFHHQLTLNGLELLGIDIQTEEGCCKFLRFRKAFIRLVARMLELDFDVLWNRRKRYYAKLWTSIISLFLCIILTISFFIQRVIMERPFDSSVTLVEKGVNRNLPLHASLEDSLSIFIPNDKKTLQIKSIREKIHITNIPGKYRNNKVRIVCKAYSFFSLDTIVSLEENINLMINRNPAIYGRVYYRILDIDGLPIPNAIVDFGFIKNKTTNDGILDISVPFEYQQKEAYPVEISYYRDGKYTFHKDSLLPYENRTVIPQIHIR